MNLFLMIAILTGCSDETPVPKIGVSVPETIAPMYTLMKQAMLEHEQEYGVEILWNGVKDKGPTKNPVIAERQQIQKMFDQRIEAVGRPDLTTFLDLLDCEDAVDFP